MKYIQFFALYMMVIPVGPDSPSAGTCFPELQKMAIIKNEKVAGSMPFKPIEWKRGSPQETSN